MKNSFKLGFLALAISLSVAACNSNKTEEAATDSTAVDTTAVDTTAVDTAAVDTAAVDTTAKK
jgi:hypothetical protein